MYIDKERLYPSMDIELKGELTAGLDWKEILYIGEKEEVLGDGGEKRGLWHEKGRDVE